MNYRESREYINGASKYGIVPGLSNITELCAALGNPQEKLKIIHIAGTNGKGSTGAFIRSALTDAGIKTGHFSSPAVFEYREQFTIDGENISEGKYAYYMSLVREAADKMEPHPTPFEMETAAAFEYFRGEDCGIAVIEAGMGGGADATNVIGKSLVSVITPISADHTKFLGTGIEEIALEKAGIIKKNGIVVSARQTDAAMAVIERVCREKGAELIVSENDTEYEISLDGDYQCQNAALAAQVLRRIDGVSESNIKNGLKNAVWHGRFEKISDNPVFIIDGAHNADGAEKLAASLKKDCGAERLIFIMGVLRDKDYRKMAEITAPMAEMIYTVTPDNPRGLSNEILAETIKEYNPNVRALSLDAAVKMCVKEESAVTVAFGSLSFLGKLKKKADAVCGMRRCSRILENEIFLKTLSLINEAEKDRIYCNHGIEHLLDVARAGYITALENGLDIKKELIYAAALLHDMGRYAQYTGAEEHHAAGAKIAAQILPECGFDEKETAEIISAVKAHGSMSGKTETLADVIAEADKKTRMCMLCAASDTCKWREEERNMLIEL
ncbi:MAG: HD domain-containing protein [Oscillospiraceae bacterium]|nr:HD domain-containing protein [Oscillospiraceae bacterium]